MTVFVKICGLTDAGDVADAVAAGADAIGFVFAKSPRQVTPAHAAELAKQIPQHILRVAVMLHPAIHEWDDVQTQFQPDVLQTDAGDFANLDVASTLRCWPVYRQGVNDVANANIDIVINRENAARFGLRTGDVQDVIQSAIGGMNVTYTVEGLERYPVNLRYNRELRDDLDQIRRVLVPTPTGAQVPLAQLTDIAIHKGPAGIKSENSKRTAWIYVDIRGVDLGSYVKNAKMVVDQNIDIPPGYSMVWSGQYEYMEKARKTLNIIVPATLVIIFILLYLHFKSIVEATIVMGTLPFAMVGGIWLIYLLDYNVSVAVVVGFIALAGLAAETGVVMLVYLDEVFHRQQLAGAMRTRKDLAAAIIEGAVERVRPKIMTVATTLIGLLPVMWGNATGAQMMKRIAAPMVGGLISSTILTLIIIPVVYFIWKQWEVKKI